MDSGINIYMNIFVPLKTIQGACQMNLCYYVYTIYAYIFIYICVYVCFSHWHWFAVTHGLIWLTDSLRVISPSYVDPAGDDNVVLFFMVLKNHYLSFWLPFPLRLMKCTSADPHLNRCLNSWHAREILWPVPDAPTGTRGSQWGA